MFSQSGGDGGDGLGGAAGEPGGDGGQGHGGSLPLSVVTTFVTCYVEYLSCFGTCDGMGWRPL